ncbi:MAG: hypothetical protein LUG93_08810 [Lachnospiraceae bacterium]|nr:hypothetical protein [Lachnospiraceae bacterium]
MKKPVVTYVLFSGHIMHPMADLADGINLYKVIPIILSKENADSLLADLRAKISSGEPLTRSDLVVLPLLPLYSGKSSQQERIRAAFEITAKADNVSRPDIEKIEAAVYASKETPPHIRSATDRACHYKTLRVGQPLWLWLLNF